MGSGAYIRHPLLLEGFDWGVGPRRLYATHTDLGNAFWSIMLPDEFWESFHLDFDGGVSIVRIPFGWKYSVILCQSWSIA